MAKKDPTIAEMLASYSAGTADLLVNEDGDIAALAGLVSDLLTITHRIAPDLVGELLAARQKRHQALQQGRRAAEFEGQLEVEEKALGLWEAVLRPPGALAS